jgi:2,3-bisphosphoglycerate-dependent phosphoglycerate mutase
MELLLIRHALPVRIEDAQGAADPPLAELGVRQSEALAAAVADEGIDVLLCSPMRRALQTAEPVAATLGLACTVVDGLAEYDRSSNWYIPIEELRAAGDPRWKDYLEDHWGTDTGIDPDGFRAGVVRTVEEVVATNRSRKVAAVAHGGVINAWTAHVLRTPMPGVFEPAYTSISRFLCAGGGERMVKSLNEATHVKGLLPPGSR